MTVWYEGQPGGDPRPEWATRWQPPPPLPRRRRRGGLIALGIVLLLLLGGGAVAAAAITYKPKPLAAPLTMGGYPRIHTGQTDQVESDTNKEMRWSRHVIATYGADDVPRYMLIAATDRHTVTAREFWDGVTAGIRASGTRVGKPTRTRTGLLCGRMTATGGFAGVACVWAQGHTGGMVAAYMTNDVAKTAAATAKARAIVMA